ncbi:MAG TPA: nuclear transport factor 2 family protein [Pseudonocardiaceae bacterium]|nr:nuclear transport factor 2 family protein [Pseudonocardiaceae bacterium]
MAVKELVRKSVDEWNKKDKKAFLGNFTESSKIIGPDGVILHGLPGIEKFWELWQGAFPDNKGTIDDIFATDERAYAEVTVEATHTGTLYLGNGRQIPATGRHICLPVAHVHTIRHGKFVISHIYFDQFDLFIQLGLMPIPAADSHHK